MVNNLDLQVYSLDKGIAETNKCLIEQGENPVPDPRAIESARRLKNYPGISDFSPKEYVESYTKSLTSDISERKLKKLYEEGMKEDVDEQIKNLRRNLPRSDYVGLKEAGDFFDYVERGGEIKEFDPYLNPNLGYFFDPPLEKKEKSRFLNYLEKAKQFAKKAAPVAVACSVLAMPLAGISGINVVSAQEDNSTNDVIDLSDVSEHSPYIYVRVDTYPGDRGASETIDFNHYEVLIKLLDKSSQKTASVLKNEDKFNKYLDSIFSDAQRAGETGVKSLIPSPEGQVLDTISKGAYGKVSHINTIAEMGWYMQNMSKNAAKMLEETRNLPVREKNTVSQNMKSSFNRKIDDAVFDYLKYKELCYRNLGRDLPDQPKGEDFIKSFDDRVEELRLHSYTTRAPKEFRKLSGPPPVTFPSLFLDVLDRKDVSIGSYRNPLTKKEIEQIILDAYLDKYGYSLPPSLDFLDVPVTSTQKEDISEVKDLAKKFDRELCYTGTEYESKRVLPEYHKYKSRLDKATEWYQRVSFEGDNVVVPAVMESKIKITPEEFTNHIDFLKSKIDEGHRKYVEKSKEDIKEVKNLKEVLNKNYGFLTRIFSDNYKKAIDISDGTESYLESNKCIIEDSRFVPEKVLELKAEMREEESGPMYKILHSIETFGKGDVQDIFANPIMMEVRNKVVDKHISHNLHFGYIKLDQERSKEAGIPVYSVKDPGTYYFDNGKKEEIREGDFYSWSDPPTPVDQNTQKVIDTFYKTRAYVKGRYCKRIVYCDMEDVVPVWY